MRRVSPRQQACYVEFRACGAPAVRWAARTLPRRAQQRLKLPVRSRVVGRARGRGMTGTGGVPHASGRVQLGDAIYTIATEEIARPGVGKVVLRWQSAQVLRILVASLGNVVTRDDLISEIWGEVSVTEDSLTQCIRDIRAALGDKKHELLVTMRKRGYQLNGVKLPDVSRAPLGVEANDLGSPSPKRTPELPGDAVPIAQAVSDTPIAAQLDPRDLLPTLAVLPMRPLHGNLSDPMGLFIAEEISTALRRSQDANIISQLSMSQISTFDSTALHNILRADFVLSGVLVADGAKVILSVELSEADRRFVLWSDRMSFNQGSLLQDRGVVDRIVDHVRNAIMMNEVRRIRTYPITDLKLFSIMHGAVGLMHGLSPRDFEKAKTYLDHIADLLPRNPMPLAWLARWHVLRTAQGWSDDAEWETRVALDFTSRALDMDPNCTLALVCEGQVLTHMAQRLDDAEARYQAALSTSPNDAQGRALRGMLSTFRDRGQEGKRDTERALHLTPLDPHRYLYLVFAAASNLATEDYERSEMLAKESLRLNRTHVSTLRTLTAAQVGLGKGDEARKTAKELLRLQPGLRVGQWLRASPSAGYEIGRRFADMLLDAGVPE